MVFSIHQHFWASDPIGSINPQKTNMTGWTIHQLKMYFLLKLVISQPVTLVNSGVCGFCIGFGVIDLGPLVAVKPQQDAEDRRLKSPKLLGATVDGSEIRR